MNRKWRAKIQTQLWLSSKQKIFLFQGWVSPSTWSQETWTWLMGMWPDISSLSLYLTSVWFSKNGRAVQAEWFEGALVEETFLFLLKKSSEEMTHLKQIKWEQKWETPVNHNLAFPLSPLLSLARDWCWETSMEVPQDSKESSLKTSEINILMGHFQSSVNGQRL